MEKRADDALSLANPRLLSAAYFGLLAVIATIVVDSFLYWSGFEQIISVTKAVLLSAVVGGLFGLLFGRLIIKSERPYRKRVFWLGFFMVLLALPIFDLGILYFITDLKNYSETNPPPNFNHLLVVYLFILFYSFIMLGLWLAILAGLAAIFLRGHLVYSIMHSDEEQRDHFFRKNKELRKDSSDHGQHLPH